MKVLIFILIIVAEVFSAPTCTPGEKFCTKCNPLTNLCAKCENPEFLVPDKNGGCTGDKKCLEGLNYCEECNEENDLCKTCSEGYYPDEIGGCSYTENCLYSYLGVCKYCQENFLLVGDKYHFQFCKSSEIEDFKHCKEIDYEKGICKSCEENYYLGLEDYKCTETEFCDISIFGKCVKCHYGHYLDHSDERKCKSTFDNQKFNFCSETEDGKRCSKCENGYYFDSENKCIRTNYCAKSEYQMCRKCEEDYYLSQDGKSCVTSDHCDIGDSDMGICTNCKRNYYIDFNDAQCKSNQEDDDLKFCKTFTDKCLGCEIGYFLADNGKCSFSRNCDSADFGECKKCKEGFFLTLDKRCVEVEKCIKSNQLYLCEECEDGYYYNKAQSKCLEAEDDLANCKITSYDHPDQCMECKNDYYLSSKSKKCISNEKEGPLYKCATTNKDDTECEICIQGYFLSVKSHICSLIEDCAVIEDGKCVECDEDCCLNVKTGKCIYNVYVEDEKEKFIYKCSKTNKDGTACETCMEGFEVNDEGLCIDSTHCEEKNDDGECIKCKNDEYIGYCVNEVFGCVENYNAKGCLRCDGILDFDNCTECEEGYKLAPNGLYNDEYSCTKITDE